MARAEKNEVGELIRKAENDYITGVTTISKYVQFSQYENIEKIDAYLNSKHTSGETDSKGRDKPFFNIVTAAVNIWYRATDIDRKDIRIKATQQDQKVAAYAATLHLQEWMRRNKFGTFLNDWGRSLARYGSSVVKFVEKEGKLNAEVIPWNRLISDTVDFENNPKIEKLWFTKAQLLKNKNYDQEIVKNLLDAVESRETADGQTKDNKADYIPVYEIHGELPLSYLTGKRKDEDEFVQQMQVVTFVAKKNGNGFDDYVLYKGKEAKDPYMITHLIREDGRAQSIGAVEHLFEAQWMKNHTIKNMKDYLDIASKLILQTNDGNFVGQNVLDAIENGDILIHGVNSTPLTIVNTAKPDITQLQAFGQQWEVLGKDIVATPEAISGGKQPSGTAWRAIEAQRQEAHSLFELMTENKGLHIEDMMREFIIPNLKKGLDTTDELAVTLDSAGVAEFDAMYVPNEAIKRNNARIKQTILSGQLADNVNPATLEPDIKKELSNLGTQRFIKPSDLDNKTWKESLKDIEWQVEVEVTDETVDKQAVMTTLTTVLQTIANPATAAVLQTPEGKLVFNRILEETGAISSLELSHIPAPAQPMPQPNVTGGGSSEAQPVPMMNNANPNPIPA